MAGRGGILFNINGIIVYKYEWGLGINTNNQVEVYTLYVEILLAIKREIKNIIILEDTYMIIMIITLSKII